MKTVSDIQLWDEFKQSVQPLNSGRKGEDLPPKLRVHRASPRPVAYCLDLHRMTIEEAYQRSVQFIERHYRLGSKKIQIITGKGRERQGLIHLEFANWLDTRGFNQYIREWKWTNDEGAVNLWLKKNR